MPHSVLEDKKKFEELKAIVEEHKYQEGPLMPILHEVQELYGYLPIEVQNYIAEALDIPVSDIYGVATFYSQFTLKPKGNYVVSICLGTACYVKGSKAILEELIEELNIQPGETTEDNMFTLDATRCIGACGLAPVMMVNDDVYGRLKPGDVKGILEKYRDL